MTTFTRLERNLPDILGDLSAAPTPEYLDDVFVRTGRMRQRPAWTFPERWLPWLIGPRAFGFAPPRERSRSHHLIAVPGAAIVRRIARRVPRRSGRPPMA
jgi:hypothetical protein